jgi:hypothetical protein
MDRRPDQIEHEIRNLRQEISARVENIAERGATDVTDANEELRSFFSRTGISSGMQDRPYAMLVGALGLGVVLGMASESVTLPKLNLSSAESTNGRNSDGDGWMNSLLSGLQGAVVAEAEDMIRGWLHNESPSQETPEATPAR